MSSEDVLLIVNHVRLRKTDGALYLMSQRLGWMPNGRETFSVTHTYADIKVQKISPDSKEKVQLQIVLNDDKSVTLQFSNPLGRDVQLTDREAVKELLVQLLPKFRRHVSSLLEAKNRLLQQDPELFQLYKDLVVSGIMLPDEFWENRKGSVGEGKNKQDVGVSPAFLADIKPQADGCNGLRYNLSADVIQSIFKTFPQVRLKHLECVPDKVSEMEFWTRFFQSHYFHRDRINFSSKDLFADCVKTDDANMERLKDLLNSESAVNLTTMNDLELDEGYGLASNSRVNNHVTANSTLIHRFNQHSTLILHTATPSDDNKIKTATKPMFELCPVAESSSVSLELTQLDKYLQGPTPVTMTSYTSSEDALQACHMLAQEVQGWTPCLPQALDSGTAVTIMGELAPGGALMKGSSAVQSHEVGGEQVQELGQLYQALLELLRHFWACFPPSTQLLEDKLVRLHSNLQKFQTLRLYPLRDKLAQQHLTGKPTQHLEMMLGSALRQFNLWQRAKKS